MITLPHKLVDCVVTKQGEENGFCALLELRETSVSLQGDVAPQRKRHGRYNLSLMFVCGPNRLSSHPLKKLHKVRAGRRADATSAHLACPITPDWAAGVQS